MSLLRKEQLKESNLNIGRPEAEVITCTWSCLSFHGHFRTSEKSCLGKRMAVYSYWPLAWITGCCLLSPNADEHNNSKLCGKIMIILILKYKSCQMTCIGLTRDVADIQSKHKESFVQHGGQRPTPYFPDSFNWPDEETQWLHVEYNLIFGFGLTRHTFRPQNTEHVSIWSKLSWSTLSFYSNTCESCFSLLFTVYKQNERA